MRRVQNLRCNCKQWWECANCGGKAKCCDDDFLRQITSLLNQVIVAPQGIRSPDHAVPEPSPDLRHFDNEIARMLDSPQPDQTHFRALLLQRVRLYYQAIGNEAYISHKLQALFSQYGTQESLSPQLANEAIREIRITDDGIIRLVLKNGQVVRKELSADAAIGIQR